MYLRDGRVPPGPHRRPDRAVARGLITTLAATLGARPPQYALEGSVFVAGAAVQWFRDGLKAIGASPEINPLSLECRPGDGRRLRARPDRPGRPLLGARRPAGRSSA